MSFKKTNLFRVAAAILSGLLLALSFAPFDYAALIWVALIPLWLSCGASCTLKQAALNGCLSGLVFFLMTIFWLTKVSVLGYLLLSAYCAIYFVPAAVMIYCCSRRESLYRSGWNITQMALVSIVWVASEYLRSTLLTGFPWNTLAISQYRNLALIQISSWGGTYAVSAIIVFINGAIALTIKRYWNGLKKGNKLPHSERKKTGPLRLKWSRPHWELIAGFLLLALCMAFGMRRLMAEKTAVEESNAVTLALVQPSIPQEEKWSLEGIKKIYSRLRKLTESAVHLDRVDLVVWPESVFPDFYRYSQSSEKLVREVLNPGTYLLAGSMDMERSADKTVFFNSSLLLDSEGDLLQKYDKQHLVIFGEYVPLSEKLPFLSALTPIEESFESGSEATVFECAGLPPFSAVICFEDILDSLARKAVNEGARWLINQSNDAWFDPSSQSLQHMSHGVFRCVENNVPTVRVCNTGVSCVIGPQGRIRDTLCAANGGLSMPGMKIVTVYPSADYRPTFYTRHGNIFAGLCLAASLVASVLICVRMKKESCRSE